ncbi:PREDICTED: junctional adhesion molecule A [Nanorana parkeri]|uniref:junctional adhesion molecule A n=1 Tax=Nanorana parkeri TaxID=125878 RepID=UPI000854D883|nr:PREDICTED: junctional adhesion molecule A [Nanorana parkeri]
MAAERRADGQLLGALLLLAAGEHLPVLFAIQAFYCVQVSTVLFSIRVFYCVQVSSYLSDYPIFTGHPSSPQRPILVVCCAVSYSSENLYCMLSVVLAASSAPPARSRTYVLSAPPISLKEGEAAEFKCSYPNTFVNPRIEWKFASETNSALIYYDNELTASYKGRVDVFPTGLRLNSVTRKDSGEYACEVTGKDGAGNPDYRVDKTELVVLVPPSVPVAQVPLSVSTGSAATLFCMENDASPRPTFVWYKNDVLMPENPKGSPTFQNSSYTLDPKTGQLRFDPVTQMDAGDFSCEASNSQGKQKSAAIRMEIKDVNVGGIVAAVIISLLLLGLIAFAVWFAYHRGYIGKKANKKVIYSQPSETRSDKNFQQTSSFLV